MRWICIVLILFCGCELLKSDWRKAESSAKEWGKNIPGFKNAICTHQDTDNDGYCGCTIFRENGETMNLECGCKKFCFVCPEGCKEVENVKVKGQSSRNIYLSK